MGLMRTDHFLRLLGHVKAQPAAMRTAQALGLSVRQLQRITTGKASVPKPVALLLVAYSKYGSLPDPPWDPDKEMTDYEIAFAAHLRANATLAKQERQAATVDKAMLSGGKALTDAGVNAAVERAIARSEATKR